MEESSKEIQNNLFLTASITENINVLQWIIEKFAEKKKEIDGAIKAVDKTGNTVLHLAALLNNKQEIIKYLLAQGADREARRIFQRTPFQLTVENKLNLEVPTLLLYKDQRDLKAKDEFGDTALHLASYFNTNQDTIENLLAKGADREARGRYQRTPSQCTVSNNSNLKVCILLYNDQSDLTAKDEFGETALHLAALVNTNQEIIKYLLGQGADREARGRFKRTPVSYTHLTLPTILRV